MKKRVHSFVRGGNGERNIFIKDNTAKANILFHHQGVAQGKKQDASFMFVGIIGNCNYLNVKR